MRPDRVALLNRFAIAPVAPSAIVLSATPTRLDDIGVNFTIKSVSVCEPQTIYVQGEIFAIEYHKFCDIDETETQDELISVGVVPDTSKNLIVRVVDAVL